MVRIAADSSDHRFDVHNCLRFDIEFCSLHHAHFFHRANIDNGRLPSNEFDKATHVGGKQIRAAPQMRTQAKSKPYRLKIVISDVEKRKECLRANS